MQDRAQSLADDYARTLEVFALLADIRFKLLAFVPAIVGATVALVSKEGDQRVVVAVSALGFVATLGILLYELRNSELYNAAVYRARVLEGKLGLTAAVATRERRFLDRGVEQHEPWPEHGGVFTERPYVPRPGERGFRLFGLLAVKHDRALALVYGAAMGGWSYLLVHASLRLAHVSAWPAFAAALPVSVIVAALVVREVNRHDDSDQMKPWRMPDQTAEIDSARSAVPPTA